VNSIQFKKSGLLIGYIQFSVLGGRDTRGAGATAKNENAITFNGSNKEWEGLYHFIQKLLEEYKKTTSSPQKQRLNTVDELVKIGDLFEKGLISEEEYLKLKKNILEL